MPAPEQGSGPFVKDRIIDLSKKAMEMLGGLKAGVIEVRLEIETSQ